MIQTELKEQGEVFVEFWNRYPEERRLIHSNNNNSGSEEEGAKNRALGVVAGVSDLEYAKRGICHFIEYKKIGGTQSPKQKTFQQKIEAEGFPYHLVYGKRALWLKLEEIRTGKIIL